MMLKRKAGSEKSKQLNWMDLVFLTAVVILAVLCRMIFIQNAVNTFQNNILTYIACAFDILLGAVTCFLTAEISGSMKKGAAAGVAVIFSPAVILTSSALGQIESVIAAVILFAAYQSIKRSRVLFASVLEISVILLIFFEMGAVYYRASGAVLLLTNHFPDFYTLLGTWHDRAAGVSCLIAAVVWISLGMKQMWKKREGISLDQAVFGAAVTGMFLTFLAPGMNYHSGFLVDILMIICIFIRPEKWYLGLGWNLTSVLVTTSVVTGKVIVPETALSVIRFIILTMTIAEFIIVQKKTAQEKTLQEKTANNKNYKNKVTCIMKNLPDMTFYLFIILTGMAARVVLFKLESYDYTHDFKAWLDVMYQNGGIRSLRMEITDYTTPYTTFLSLLTTVIPQKYEYYCLYAMKLLSGLFDIAAGLLSAEIIYHMTRSRKKAKVTFAVVFFLPTVLINSAAWGQCDIIYVTFLLAFILYILKEKPFLAMIFLGIALSIKLQAVFVLPVLLAALLVKKVRWSHLLLLPGVYFLTMLPALIMGRTFWSLFDIYFTQAGEFAESLSMHAPNLYYLTGVSAPDVIGKIGFLTAFLLIGTITYLTIRNELLTGNFCNNLIMETILIIAVCCYFLPHMHERYGFLADILIVIAAVIRPERWPYAAAWNFIAVIPYLWYMTGYLAIDMSILAVAQFVVLTGLSYEMIRSYQKNEKELITLNSEGRMCGKDS